jgi:uncharacterized protein (DUF1778 family)
MPKDDLLRIRCSAADKTRFKAAAESAGESLSEFVIQAAKLRAAQLEHGSATRLPKAPVKDVIVPEPLDAQGIRLSGGVTLGKRSFRPDPK